MCSNAYKQIWVKSVFGLQSEHSRCKLKVDQEVAA